MAERLRRFAARVLAVAALICAWSSSPAFAGGDIEGELRDGAAHISRQASAAREAAQAAVNASVPPEKRLIEYARGRRCNVSSPTPTTELNAPCADADGFVDPPFCGDGIAPLEALWRHTRPAPHPTPWGPYQFVSPAICPQDVLPEFTVEDFRRLPLTPSTPTTQPTGPDLLTGLGLVVRTNPDPQDIPTDLLGYPLTVRATPTEFTWDFGDGTTRTTTGPGHPYPSDYHPGRSDPLYPPGVIGHPYPTLGTYTPTLTTTWTGEYLLTGTTTWHPINGTATTTTTLPTVTIHETKTHLVEDNCHENPHGPGC
jgi:hypothetical protein